MPTCTVCGGVEFSCSDGLFYCAICSTQSQEVREEELDHNLDYEGRHGGLRVDTGKKTDNNPEQSANHGRPWRTYEALQIILKEQAKALIRLGADPSLLDISFRLWTLYLGKCGIAFVDPGDQELTRNILGTCKLKSREKYPGSIADPRIKPIRLLGTRKRKHPEVVSKHLLEHMELLNKIQGETFYVGDKPVAFNSAEMDLITKIETEARVQEEAESRLRDDMVADSEGLTVYRDECFVVHHGSVNRLSMIKVLAITSLALMYTNSQMTPSDIVGWVKDGRLPYMRAVSLLPPDMHFFNKDSQTFFVQALPTPEHLLDMSGRIIDFLELKKFPLVDIGLLASRYIIELNLPCEMHALVGRLIEKREPHVQYRCNIQKKDWIPNCSALAVAYIIIVLKLLFGVNDVTERNLTKFAHEPSVRAQFDCPLFVWDDWVSASEQQLAYRRVAFYPVDCKGVHNVRDTFAALNHFDTVIERHLRYSASSKHYTEYHLHQMEQVHSEVKRIYRSQRLPSLGSMEDNEESVSTHDCDVTNFSKFTLRYITDRKSLSNNNDDNMQMPFDANIDSDTPCLHSMTSDEMFTISQESLPDVTANYCISEECLMSDSSLSDILPCSYRWLICRCAEHLHMKPTVIEQYVQRLELLLLVPSSKRTVQQRKIVNSFARRCFAPLKDNIKPPTRKRGRGRPHRLR